MADPSICDLFASEQPLSIADLERYAAGPPTFLPDWPAPAGFTWVVAAPDRTDGLELRSFAVADLGQFDAWLDLAPLFSLWFAIPTAMLRAPG